MRYLGAVALPDRPYMDGFRQADVVWLEGM